MSAAIATAVAGVASAGVAAYSASQQGKGGADMYGSKVEPVPFESKVGTADSYAAKLPYETNRNVEASLPELFGITTKINAFQRRGREKDTGGTFYNTQKQEGANILAMEKGEVPGDVQDSIHRIVAQHLGGAFNPSSGGKGGFNFSQPQGGLARALGLSSMDVMKAGMTYAPAWRSNVNSFLYKPQDAAKDIYNPMMQAGLDASKIQNDIDQSNYNSANNIARAEAMPDPQAVGSANDQAVGMAELSKAIPTFGSALAGLASAYGTPSNTISPSSSSLSRQPYSGHDYLSPYRAG